jgi:hypothetical protein
MSKVYVSAVLDAPIGRVWARIREFNGLAGWVPAVAASEIVGGGTGEALGSVRVLTLGDGGIVKERLLAVDDFDHSYRYSIIESPLPIENYVARIALKPVTSSDRTFVEWSGEFDVLVGDPEDLRKLFGESVYGAGLARLAEILGTAG